MAWFLVFSHATTYLIIILAIAGIFIYFSKKYNKTGQEVYLPEPPKPKFQLPIIGHLHLLGGYKVPYQAFTALGKKYGPIIKLKLGNVNGLVVNGQEYIREVLFTKGNHFDSRPDFERYQKLFGGNKENSLAFCNWSDTQKQRREMLRAYTFPRAFTNKYNTLENIISVETTNLVSKIKEDKTFAFKPLILKACFNVFTSHFCSKRFKTDQKTTKTIEAFDEIFWEVNQGYAADFLPFLMPFHNKNLKRMNELTEYIREYITDHIIEDRFKNYAGEEPNDYVESLIRSVKMEEMSDMDWNMAMYALEDIIGGHSAVGNFVMKIFGYLVKEPKVQKKIQEEIESVLKNTHSTNRNVSIFDRNQMPYTEGVIFEAIRLIASPIVPRVANQESCVNGYRIKKDTVVFLNNYDLSMSGDLWDEPEKFKPERFIQEGRLYKPDHFLPFGGGRRSCMGYKIVQLTTFGILTSVLQHFTVLPTGDCDYEVPVGSLALPKDTFRFTFKKR